MTENKMTYKEKAFPYWRTKFISYFDIGEHTIKMDISTLTARESVFIDEALVSNKRNLGEHSIHQFKLNNEDYEIEVDIKNAFTGPIDITLKKEGIAIDGDHWVFPYSRPGTILGLTFAAGAIVAAILFNTVF